MSVMLMAKDIRKSFGDVEVLKGVSLTAHKGDVIAMIGSSGSGKSTFLRCLNFLENPTSGDIALDGVSLPFRRNRGGDLVVADETVLRHYRARVTMVFQQFNLWSHMTARENVILGLIRVKGLTRAEARDRAEAHLARVGLDHRMDAYPGFLSGGEQQRVAIARALAMEPELMLFDEPTSALDPELVGEVLRVIRGLAEEGRTMIVVTHEMNFARDVANRVLFLNEGVICEQGDPADVMTNPATERLQTFLAAQTA